MSKRQAQGSAPSAKRAKSISVKPGEAGVSLVMEAATDGFSAHRAKLMSKISLTERRVKNHKLNVRQESSDYEENVQQEMEQLKEQIFYDRNALRRSLLLEKEKKVPTQVTNTLMI